MTDPDTPLIESLDRLAALAKLPRADRIRQARAEIEEHREMLGLGQRAFENDDGRQWGRIDPETGVWSALDKLPILRAGLTAPCYWTGPGGALIHVVPEPPSATPGAAEAERVRVAADDMAKLMNARFELDQSKLQAIALPGPTEAGDNNSNQGCEQP